MPDGLNVMCAHLFRDLARLGLTIFGSVSAKIMFLYVFECDFIRSCKLNLALGSAREQMTSSPDGGRSCVLFYPLPNCRLENVRARRFHFIADGLQYGTVLT